MAETKKKPGRPAGSKNKKKDEAKKKAQVIQEKNKLNKRLKDEIWAITCMALGAFLFAAVQFKAAGQFGEALGDSLKGVFGLVSYVLPWYLIGFGVLLFLHKTVNFTWKTGVLVVLTLLMFCLLNSERFIDAENLRLELSMIKTYYESGVTLKSGGAFGMYVGSLLIKFIGVAGLNIFALLVIVVSLLLVINTPISKGLQKLHDKKEARALVKEEMSKDDVVEADSPKLDKGKRRSEKYEKTSTFLPFIEKGRSKYSGSLNSNNVIKYMTDDSIFGRVDEDEKVAPLPQSKLDEVELVKDLEIYNSQDLIKEPYTGIQQEIKMPEIISGPEVKKSKKASKEEGKEQKEQIENEAPVEKMSNKEAKEAMLSPEEIASGKLPFKYTKPSVELLNKPIVSDHSNENDKLALKAQKLEETLQNFKVDARVIRVTQGPAITRYEIQPNVGVKVNSIVRLADDIALNLEAKSIRIEAPIPGKAAVGIEVENEKINMVTIREIIGSNEFKKAKSNITFAVGKDIAGNTIVADLKGMPHLLIAGSTGSGKSVCINSIITSILYKATPEQVKLVLVDPKVVELGNYNGIPHLLIPVVTEPSKAAAALNWAVAEMGDRYKKFAEEGVRDLESYNEYVLANGEEDKVMAQIVIIIDELADLMMAAPSQVEESICRLAQMARAAGMHLIVATQRPSVDVITGVIKANIPSRIAFAVSSQFDSRTILDMAGAEKLVGKGDMLFNPLGLGKPIRVQGTFISDQEVNHVIEHVKGQVPEVKYANDVITSLDKVSTPVGSSEEDELLPDAIECVVQTGQASISMLQRRFRIGYNRAARIVDMMEERNIIGPADGSRPRQVLMTEDELLELKKDTEEN